MNIFFLSDNPYTAAKYHCDKHVCKMIVETAQLLCTAHHVLDRIGSPGTIVATSHAALYKATHINHPCAVWVRESNTNYRWTYSLLDSLCREYTLRYQKVHLTQTKLLDHLCYVPLNIKSGHMTDIPLAMPEKYSMNTKKTHDPHFAMSCYQKYYIGEKHSFAKWTKREVPYFWPTTNSSNLLCGEVNVDAKL